MTATRGIRNHNPLNIRRNATTWQGLRKEQTDGAFFQFDSPDWGYRAALKTLRTYQTKYHLLTLSEMIRRWAPPNENDTAAYIRVVSNRAKIRDGVAVDLANKDVACRLLEAMSYVENGQAGDRAAIERAFDLAI